MNNAVMIQLKDFLIAFFKIIVTVCAYSILKTTMVQREMLPEEYRHGVLLMPKQKFHQVQYTKSIQR